MKLKARYIFTVLLSLSLIRNAGLLATGFGSSTFRTKEYVQGLIDTIAMKDLRELLGEIALLAKIGVNSDAQDLLEALIVKVVIEKKVDINSFDEDGNTFLHSLASLSRVRLVTLLLSLGADCTLENKQGLTPLQVAKQTNNKAIGKLLLEAFIKELEKRVELRSAPRKLAKAQDIELPDEIIEFIYQFTQK